MSEEKESQSRAGDLVKKVLTAGVGAIFLTEESLRALLSEIKIPKELLSGILDSAGKTKNEFLSRLSSDVLDRVANRVDPRLLIQEVLEKNEIEFTVRVRFRPKKSGDSAGDSQESANSD